jgi:hypothetical protein
MTKPVMKRNQKEIDKHYHKENNELQKEDLG